MKLYILLFDHLDRAHFIFDRVCSNFKNKQHSKDVVHLFQFLSKKLIALNFLFTKHVFLKDFIYNYMFDKSKQKIFFIFIVYFLIKQNKTFY